MTIVLSNERSGVYARHGFLFLYTQSIPLYIRCRMNYSMSRNT
jgi:hypothetical protein